MQLIDWWTEIGARVWAPSGGYGDALLSNDLTVFLGLVKTFYVSVDCKIRCLWTGEVTAWIGAHEAVSPQSIGYAVWWWVNKGFTFPLVRWLAAFDRASVGGLFFFSHVVCHVCCACLNAAQSTRQWFFVLAVVVRGTLRKCPQDIFFRVLIRVPVIVISVEIMELVATRPVYWCNLVWKFLWWHYSSNNFCCCCYCCFDCCFFCEFYRDTITRQKKIRHVLLSCCLWCVTLWFTHCSSPIFCIYRAVLFNQEKLMFLFPIYFSIFSPEFAKKNLNAKRQLLLFWLPTLGSEGYLLAFLRRRCECARP